jgi:uncharacterized glyoxalase superfamily protein PhnB
VSATSQVRTVSPFLLVRDVKRAAAYYDMVLGFATRGFWGDPPMFAIADRDGVSVMLRQVKPEETFTPNAACEDCLDAYFSVRDADALHDEYKAKGADIVCAPETQVYMMREFQVRDPDGHVLTFAHDTSNQGANNG